MKVWKIEVIRTLGMITFAFSLIFALAAATLASLYTLRGQYPPAPLYIVQGQVADNIANEVAKVYAKAQEFAPQLIFLFALPNALIETFTCIAAIPLRMVLIYHPPLSITIIDISIGVFTQALADLWFIDAVYHTATGNSLISTVWGKKS
jgi:hypothetical protein